MLDHLIGMDNIDRRSPKRDAHIEVVRDELPSRRSLPPGDGLFVDVDPNGDLISRRDGVKQVPVPATEVHEGPATVQESFCERELDPYPRQRQGRAWSHHVVAGVHHPSRGSRVQSPAAAIFSAMPAGVQ